MKKTFLILLLLVFFSLSANDQYKLLVDFKLSPYIGAEDIITVHEGAEIAVHKFLKIPKTKNPIYITTRIAEVVFIWLPLSEVEIVVQHEVFGHGYRIRDIGDHFAEVSKYEIGKPTPYGRGGGATFYWFNDNFTSFQECAVSIAGVEATSILANRLKMKYMNSLKIDPLKSMLYLQAQHDLTGYIYSMNDSIFIVADGHDIECYIKWLNNTYFDKKLTKQDLKQAALINLVDPFTYYNFGAYFYYIFTGKDFNVPMIKIKNIRYLPSFRLGLAPYGIEYFFENFISYKNRAIYSYIRAGSHEDTYFGVGLEMQDIFKTKKHSLGFRVDLFNQPKIYFKGGATTFEGIQVGYSEKDLHKKLFGSSFYLMYDRRFSKNSNFSFHMEVGYKTKGFVPGEYLRNGLNVRIGLANGVF